METITFRCESCAASLRVPADKVGHKARCKRCGAVVTIPASVLAEPECEAPLTVGDGAPEAGQPRRATGDANEAGGQPAAVPAARRKRPRGQKDLNRSAYLRSAPGWRKVRLGLILIAFSMWCSMLLTLVLTLFDPQSWAPLRYLVQALPIAGNVLCAFVPLKGTARNLAIANLGVIAVSLALTIVADRLAQQLPADLERSIRESVEQATLRSKELTNKPTAGNKEAAKQDDELHKKVAELRKQAASGDQEAGKQAEELDKKLAGVRKQRAAENAEAMKQALAEIQAATKFEPESFKLPLSMRFWAWIQGQGSMFTLSIQIMILSFYIQAIAMALDVKDSAARCPRVAVLALLTLSLLVFSTMVSPAAWFVRLVGWISYLLGLVSIVWQAVLVIEGCAAIGKHLNRKST